MNLAPHPVLEHIDIDRPYFTRVLNRITPSNSSECELQIWLPVQLGNGGWVSAVHITGLNLPPISAMPGKDPLDALVQALAFARRVVDEAEGRFLFSEACREGAGLPLPLDRGFPPETLKEVEARAAAFADATFQQTISNAESDG